MPVTLRPNFVEPLRALSRHGVDFILVGGLAAAAQGAPIVTFDVDVVYSTEPSNLSRLKAALDDLDGHYRAQPERRLRPQLDHLAAGGYNLLMPSAGPLDLLGSIGNSRDYRELLPHAVTMDVGQGTIVQVLDLETVIAVKEEAAGDKDRAALPILRRTLEESRRK